MSANCIFCKIAKKEIPAQLLVDNEHLVALDDTSPKAPIHTLVIPKEHVTSIMDDFDGEQLYPAIFRALQKIARDKGVSETGFRIIVNAGPEAGQSVDHLHFHLMGGRPMKWPPG